MTTFKALQKISCCLIITPLLVLIIISVGAANASPVLAAGEAHPKVGEFGSFSNPNGIAVEESTGDVYVADMGTDKIYKYEADGKPVDFASLGSNELSGASTLAGSFAFPASEKDNPAAIAVDNSTSASDPSRGDLYVMDAGHEVIDKFNSKGEYINQIAGPFSGELLGLGVDGEGDVQVDVNAASVSVDNVDVFDNAVDNNYVTGLRNVLQEVEPGSDRGFAAGGPRGDDYFLSSGCGCVEKWGGNLEYLGIVASGSEGVAVAVDQVTGHVYVDEQSSVAEWDTGGMNGPYEALPTATLVSSFGSGELADSPEHQGGIAVNGASGRIYVSDPADGKVYAYGTDVPGVTAEAAANVTQTSATLTGAVDPHGLPVSECRFEYEVTTSSGTANLGLLEPVTEFSHSVECAQTAEIGSGMGPVAVSADIGELAPGSLYHFRLVVANMHGRNESDGLFATAGPGFGITPGGFEVAFRKKNGTADTQAGSHPYEMVTNIAFNTQVLPRETVADSRYGIYPDGNVKDIIMDLPPGLVGDPDATTIKCTLTQLESNPGGGSSEGFGENSCPAESQVGELEVEFGFSDIRPVREPVFNMVAPHGVAAQIGANFEIPKVFVNVGLLAGGDYPLQAASLSIPTVEAIVGIRFTVFGVVGSGEHRKPFLTLPTGCTGPLGSSIYVDSYQHPGAFLPDGQPNLADPNWVKASTLTRNGAGEPVTLSGCSKLIFPPTISVSSDTTNASTSSGLTVGVHVPQTAAFNPDGLAESALRDTTVTLPEGVTLNPAGANNLEACSEELAGFEGFTEFNSEFEPRNKTATFSPTPFGQLQPGVSFCPDGSKIGTVKVKTPLLEHELEGAVYLADQNANPFGSLVAMYMMVEDPFSGSTIKLIGEVHLTETGQIVTTFKNTPDLPFENLEIHFFGGERAPLTTPSRCGTYTTQASFTPWDGNGPVNTSSSFQITSGPNGGPCPGASLPFDPSLTAGTTSIQAGGFSPFTMTMIREDGQQNLQAISLNMPAGLSGLLSGVKLCEEEQANAGTCGPESLIGETTVSVGVGSDPFTVTGGKVYITGPYEGAPFGLSIVDPAVAGPYNLGQVIVRAKIEVNPVTAALTITSDNSGPYKIPQYIDGIPLQIKHVNVTITGVGGNNKFTFNPTNCDKTAITGSLDSTEGATDALSVPFQATNCATLGFAPTFSVSTSGKTSKAKGASLSVKLTYPSAPFGSQANIKQVKVELPKSLPSRLTTLQKACTAAQFNANPAGCPAASVIGHAKAITPLIPVPLEGPAYFVSHGGEAFPSLIVVLQGYGVTIDLVGTTFISKAGITSSTFKTVPDAPVGSFELTLPEGKYSALTALGNVCTEKLTMPTEFVAQNGAVIHQSTKIGVTGCAKKKALTRAQKFAEALKACHKKKGAKRAGCERLARKRYGPLKKGKHGKQK